MSLIYRYILYKNKLTLLPFWVKRNREHNHEKKYTLYKRCQLNVFRSFYWIRCKCFNFIFLIHLLTLKLKYSPILRTQNEGSFACKCLFMAGWPSRDSKWWYASPPRLIIIVINLQFISILISLLFCALFQTSLWSLLEYKNSKFLALARVSHLRAAWFRSTFLGQ